MADKSFLSWPFFEPRHRALAEAIERWCGSHLPAGHGDVDAACRELVALLGRDGWLAHSAVDPDKPGNLDVRTLCLMRETLALQPKQIIVDETPMHVYMEMILQRLTGAPRVAFADLFTPPRHRARLVGLFLAILELIKSRRVLVEQEQAFDAIWMVRNPDAPATANGADADTQPATPPGHDTAPQSS